MRVGDDTVRAALDERGGALVGKAGRMNVTIRPAVLDVEPDPRGFPDPSADGARASPWSSWTAPHPRRSRAP